MQTITTIGLDIAKSVFQVHGVNAGGEMVIRRQIASIAVARLPSRVLPRNNQHSRWTRLEKVYHVNTQK
jgi:transposase